MKFSANLSFLWNDSPLPEAIRAAKAAGFDAVECHWPYETPGSTVLAALQETGLSMLGLNTRRGAVATGENGLAALPGREAEARAAIDEAIAYAKDISAGAVHVMAGNSSGPRARSAFCENLAYACDRAGQTTILIEPLNPYNAPGYFLNGTGLAADIIREVGKPNLKLMFDFYHVQCLEGDVIRRFERLLPLIGHVQIAAVPDRREPDHGELDYGYVLKRVAELGWSKPIGAEYMPENAAAPDFNWMINARRSGAQKS
jgi:2-dehydrotetronate isomerase